MCSSYWYWPFHNKNLLSKPDIELKNIETEKLTILQSLNIEKIRLEEEKSSAKTTLNNTLNQILQIETDINREQEIKQKSELFAEQHILTVSDLFHN